jgi:hypothetical protein
MKDKKELFPVVCCGAEAPQCGPGPEDNKAEDWDSTDRPWQIGTVSTPAGTVNRVATALDRSDVVGTWKARWGVGRMNYRIPPGLYAVGDPDRQSPVLVSANYKMSFDFLRRELSGLDLWLIVIDTKGINVWCAAGKGTFGTAEIVRRIEKVRLHEVVSHRKIILPQLAAPGVAAHEVQKQSGFQVIYGPVRAGDIPAFLQEGGKATPEMRQVRFRLKDRLVLTPVEVATVMKPALFLLAALLGLNFLSVILKGSPLVFTRLWGRTAADFLPFLGAILAGTVLTPALLPYLPGRAFAWKGWLLGVLWALAYMFYLAPGSGPVRTAAHLLFLPAAAAFLAMNFTGSSTYTSLSGVVKEMGFALPAIIIAAGLGAAGLIAAYFL